MPVDVRCNMICSLGTVTRGQLSDSLMTEGGLITTTGTIEIAGINLPARGAEVQLAYHRPQNNTITRFPRRLRVLGATADPYRGITKVEVGCKLALQMDLRKRTDRFLASSQVTSGSSGGSTGGSTWTGGGSTTIGGGSEGSGGSIIGGSTGGSGTVIGGGSGGGGSIIGGGSTGGTTTGGGSGGGGSISSNWPPVQPTPGDVASYLEYTPPIRAQAVLLDCLGKVSITLASGSQALAFSFLEKDIDLSQGYLRVVDGLLKSEACFGYLTMDEKLMIQRVNLTAASSAAVLRDDDLIDLRPMEGAEEPADRALVSY